MYCKVDATASSWRQMIVDSMRLSMMMWNMSQDHHPFTHLNSTIARRHDTVEENVLLIIFFKSLILINMLLLVADGKRRAREQSGNLCMLVESLQYHLGPYKCTMQHYSSNHNYKSCCRKLDPPREERTCTRMSLT